jgi:hypothetical protein
LKIFTAIWVAGLLIVSLQPLRPAPTSGLYQLHRPFHFVVFALTALVLWSFFAITGWTLFTPRVSVTKASIKAVFATIVLGGIIEVLQHLIYHNQMEWWDVRDDGVSAIAAILLGHAIRGALAARGSS